MDVQLQELIDKIKKDGVAAAETASQAIIAEAEKKANAIIAEAEDKKAQLLKDAKSETERMEKASVDAIGQAGRNLLITFRDSVIAELDRLITSETTSVYNADMLKTLIPETVKAWAANTSAENLAVLLSEKDLATLSSGFQGALKAEIAKGLEFKADSSLTEGFRIGEKDGSAYYDFSAESVAELFAAYLNPFVSKVLKEAAK